MVYIIHTELQYLLITYSARASRYRRYTHQTLGRNYTVLKSISYGLARSLHTEIQYAPGRATAPSDRIWIATAQYPVAGRSLIIQPDLFRVRCSLLLLYGNSISSPLIRPPEEPTTYMRHLDTTLCAVARVGDDGAIRQYEIESSRLANAEREIPRRRT